MKLLNYTTTYFAALLFVLLSAWAVVFYFDMLDEIYDSMDDGLENQKMLVIQKARKDPSILSTPEFEDGYYTIEKAQYDQVLNFTDSYRDTLMYMQNERDFEPVRLLESVFEQDGTYYKVKVITSMVEEDDLIEDLLFSLFWLYFGLILSVLILNNLILKKVWLPFYELLARLKRFNIEKNDEIKFEPTNIEEFSLLNERVEKLLKKSVESYTSQKEFIENASHELQTPLAISINKLELLVESADLDEEQLKTVGVVLNNLERLTRFNKSLLLLSRIENRQFLKEEVINFNELSKKIIFDFEDLARHKEAKIEITEHADLHYSMNKDLAVILISNLIKNALIHGTPGETIKIKITENLFQIKNPGAEMLRKPEEIFSRFQSSGNERKSTGLGLAISKAIADRFNLNLKYLRKDSHIFEIHFPKS